MNFIKNNDLLNTLLLPDGILRISLNSPSSHNVLSEEMMFKIQSSLDNASNDKNTRVIIVSAEGSSFSAGHDLKELKAGRKSTHFSFF